MTMAANAAIEDALLHGACFRVRAPSRAGGGRDLGGIREIAKAWRRILATRGLTVGLTGVFCHAAPMVTFKDSRKQLRRCELADLLIVVDVNGHGPLIRRAALVQAKMARARERVSLSGRSSRVQLDLYQNWHRFDFEEAAYPINFSEGSFDP
jgi:hypothetical protein